MRDVTNSATERQMAEEAVKNLNRQYPGNRNYSASTFLRVGKTTVYKVHFTDESGNEEYDNWAVIRGDQVKAYFFLDTMLIDRDSGLFEHNKDIDYLKLLVTSGLAIMFSLAVIWIVINKPDNQSLQVLTGLAGLTIGYLVGQSKGAGTA